MATLAPNFESITGQQSAKPLYPSMGVQAKSPSTGMVAPTNTIPKKQTAPIKPPTSTPNTTGNTATGYAATDPTKIINNTTGQTAAQAASATPATRMSPGDTGGQTPNGATVDASGNITKAAPGSQGLYASLTNAVASTPNSFAGPENEAQQKIKDLGTQIGQIQGQAAINEGTVGGQGLLPTAMGRAQQIGQTAAAAEGALGTQQQAQQGLYNNLLQQQSQQQSALGTAAGLASPANTNVQLPYNMQYINGSSGAPVGGASGPGSTNGTLSDAVNNAVQLIKNGSGYNNAAGTLNAYGQAGTNALIQALGPGFNINSSNAQAAAQAQNINTSATATKDAANAGYSQSLQGYQNLNQSYTGAQNLGQLLASTMEKGGINSNGSVDLNQAANTLAAHLSSADYTNFISTLNSTRTAYQNILTAAGSTPTGAEASLIASLNPNSSMNAIISNVNQLNQEIYSGKVVPAASTVNYYKNLLGQ